MADLDDLFQDIREACSPRSWSKGIELARTDAVHGLDVEPHAATLRVRTPDTTVAPTVTLYLDDAEWVCDCNSTADACEHAAAAVIALRKARKEGHELPSSRRVAGTLHYALVTDDERLQLTRWIVSDAGKTLLQGSITGVLDERDGTPTVDPTQIDLSIDRLLLAKRVRSYTFDAFLPFLPLLSDAPSVELDGVPIRVSPQPLGPRAIVRDAPHRAAVVRFETPSAFERVVVPGLALARDGASLVLRPVGLAEIVGLKLERLPRDTHYPRHRIAELISETLPRLRAEAEVVSEARHLPDKQRSLAPHALLQVEQRGAALSVLPLLVYGDPPCARVDTDDRGRGNLVHLGGPVPERDPRAERRVVAQLAEALELVPGRRVEVTGRDALELAKKLRSYHGEVDGSAHLDHYPTAPLSVAVDIRADGLELSVSAGERTADPKAVLDAFRAGEAVVPLLGGGWAELPTDWLSRHADRIEQLLAARATDGTVARHARPALAALCRELEHPPLPELERLTPLLAGYEGLPHAPLPDDLHAELRDYQRLGIDWLSFLRDAGLGAVLADDMGLGKTLQALATINGRTLVVCPRSVVHNWADELRKFRPSLRHAVYHGVGRALDDDADVTLTTYALLRADIDTLAGLRWDAVILDESQAIKNPDSQVAQAAYRLRADFRVTLSGTPVENRLEELWSQMHFANPGLLGGRSQFRDGLARPIESGEPEALVRLRERIRPFVLRRTKTNVLRELPPRTDVVLHCELAPHERDVYEALSLATKKTIVAQLSAGGGVMEALEALLRLRQAACDSRLIPGAEPSTKPSSKIRRLMLALEQIAAEGHKALVFSQWTSLLDRVEPELTGAAIPFLRLDGSTRDRGAVVSAFQDPGGPPVLLISLKAGGTGLNLTAADHVFLLDPWWNPAAEDQAADRAHRIGQERPVMVYRLVAKETVEERILALQEHKRALADAALTGAGRAAQLTRDDLLALFD